MLSASLFTLCRELREGIPVTDENGNRLGVSAVAAKDGIIQVVFSRIGMAVPGMGTSFLSFYIDVIKIQYKPHPL